ncbi:NAD(P)-dependent dehydrogenase (short-subunit alcohol dehydrogenase family) [Paraburkholderia sp. JPY158]|uniref:NAD(P)-dependent dehydrogenase (Short-subunit alcohol dehydrogenase family) n=1 Tax=Paraburkholderia atlantica TaxID=2654982 RepID=A0A7W8V5F7_PARAM|nr:oxidoreductase [Paraburkholderia atlantica]MBB5423578.1 NAD(P)-dependent dehydrogenase (short-subunit alcohol dehydrogenase family) [Paraburkholderia atlantica]
MWFITGVSSGFGRSLAEAVLARGDKVVGTVRNDTQIAPFENLAPGRAHGVLLDVTDAAAVPRAIGQALERTGAIDILVNNAGYGLFGALEEVSDAEARQLFDTNVFGTVNVIRAVLPHFRARKRGHIVNFSSVAGVIGIAGCSFYCASKHAIEGLSESLAQELHPFGIGVTLVEPGGFRTNFAGGSLKWSGNELPDYSETVGQMRRYMSSYHGTQAGDPAKAAEAIVRAVSADAPPLRLPLGPDAVDVVRKKLASVQDNLETWLEVSSSTNFDQ